MPAPHEWTFLPYEERFVRVLEQEFEGEPCGSPFYFPEDPDEKVPIILELSLNEFTRLLSAVTKGSTLTYPLESDSVNWLLLKGVECPVDLCAIITACIGEQLTNIENGVNAMQAQIDNINDLVERGTAANSVQPPTPSKQASCDEPRAASGAYAVIDWINTTIIDLMQATEAATPSDTLEEWALIIGAIPIFETLPIDDLFSVVDWMFTQQQEDYEAAFDTVWRRAAQNQLRCRIMSSDCTLSYKVIEDWLRSLRALYPGNIAADIFTRFGEATGAGAAQQLNQFLNQVLNGRNQGTIFEFYAELIDAYDIGIQSESFAYDSCDDCNVVNEPAVPLRDNWTFDTREGQYGDSWQILRAPNTLEVVSSSTREIAVVRVYWFSRYAPITPPTVSINGSTPEPMAGSWGGWGIPNLYECILASPIEGEEILIDFDMPDGAYTAIGYVEYESCPIV